LCLGLQAIILAVEKTQKYLRHPDDQKEIGQLQEFILNAKFQKLLKLHNKVVDIFLCGNQPLISGGTTSASDLSSSVLSTLPARHSNVEARELHDLLNTSHFNVSLIDAMT